MVTLIHCGVAMGLFDISCKKILVTGASRGIGESIVRNLVKSYKDVSVCISGTNKERLESIAHELGGNVYPIVCNLNDIEQVEKLADSAKDAMSGIDGLVCNAGITKDGLSVRMKYSDWREVLKVNLDASFILNRNTCKTMLRNKSSGSIINISSIVAYTGNPGQINYSASKAGMIAMSKSLALEFAQKNIRINCIAPGFIQTFMTDKLTGDYKQHILDKIPMKRIGVGDEIAGAAIFLMSNASSYITGEVMHVNGGMLMQ